MDCEPCLAGEPDISPCYEIYIRNNKQTFEFTSEMYLVDRDSTRHSAILFYVPTLYFISNQQGRISDNLQVAIEHIIPSRRTLR